MFPFLFPLLIAKDLNMFSYMDYEYSLQLCLNLCILFMNMHVCICAALNSSCIPACFQCSSEHFSIFGGNSSHKKGISLRQFCLELPKRKTWGNKEHGFKRMALASIFTWLKYRNCFGSSSRMSSGIPVGFQNDPLPFSPKKIYSFPFNGFPWLTETKPYADDKKQWICFHVSWVRSITLSLCLLIRSVLSWRNRISFLHRVINDKINFSGRCFKKTYQLSLYFLCST